jgi:polysaccharide pyruvyl transferase WcaK-like protein
LGKPVALFAHSFNPFDSDQEKRFTQNFLNQVKVITVREALSQEYLNKIGIAAPVYKSADPAFLMPGAAPSEIDAIFQREGLPRTSPLVGISASALMGWHMAGNFDRYTTFLADLADYIIRKHNLAVVFFPHVIGPNQLGGDDRLAAEAVRQKMKFQQQSYSILGEYNALELKGVIGQCRLFIGSRMHAAIAAASQQVPTIGLAYSIKAHGVLGELVQSRPVVFNLSALCPGDLAQVIDDVLNNYDLIRSELGENLLKVKERAWLSSQLSALAIADSRSL